MKRREFLKISVCTAAILLAPKIEAKVLKNSKAKKTTIAILGGGFAGLSTAKYLKELNPSLDVTLIEKRTHFISCPISNTWLGGLEGFEYEDLNFDYNSSIQKYKYNFINEAVIDINIQEKLIKTQNTEVQYDYMIMALGIDYNYKKLFRRNKQKIKQAKTLAPAGLKPGSELLKLKRMIKNFKGGNFVITLPSSSYKCPPVPYERACMIANYFKSNNIKGKVVLVDPRVKPASKAKPYLDAFSTIYKDYIEYKNLRNFKDIDFDKKIAYLKYFNEKEDKYLMEELNYEEISIIPPNKAHKLYKKAKIKTYAQGWVKLRKPTFRTVSNEDVYVIGDAQGEYPFPKSAQMANSCALVVAQDIISRIKKEVFDYKSALPSNICYSIIAPNKAAWVTHDYKYTNNKLEVKANTSNITNESFDAAKLWYKSITNDLFGLKG